MKTVNQKKFLNKVILRESNAKIFIHAYLPVGMDNWSPLSTFVDKKIVDKKIVDNQPHPTLPKGEG